MIATCAQCGLRVTLIPTGRDKYSLQLPDFFAAKCPILAEQLKKKGKLEGEEIDCPQMNQATGAMFRQWCEQHHL